MLSFIPKDELPNVLTHFSGIVLSIIGIPIIICCAINFGNLHALIDVIAFSFGLIAVYTSSTVYHAMKKESLKQLWKKIDHISIYFLIAGTYTAYIFLYLDEGPGHIFLVCHWLLVIGGVIFKLFYCGKYELFSTILYLLLGWMVVFILQPLVDSMSTTVLYYIIGGGVAYSIGVIFYVWEKYKINHSIWHIFVLLGSAFHYAGILAGL